MSPESQRDWRLYAEDIITACSKVRRFIAGMTFEAFAADERTQDAVIRNIEIIGEAAKNIPDEVVAIVTRKAPTSMARSPPRESVPVAGAAGSGLLGFAGSTRPCGTRSQGEDRAPRRWVGRRAMAER